MNLKNNKGYVMTDISIAVIILLILVPVIMGILYNVNSARNSSNVKSVALNIVTNSLEAAKGIDMDSEDFIGAVLMEVKSIYDANSNKEKDTEIDKENGIATIYLKNASYQLLVEVEDYADDKEKHPDALENVVKTVTATVSYKIKGQEQSINISTVIDKGNISVALKGLSETEKGKLPLGVKELTIDEITNDNLKDLDKIKAVITGPVPIPKDATYVEGTESTGVVIEYKGSEFVWVPVPVTPNNDLYVKGTTKPMAKVATVEGYAATEAGKKNYEGILYKFSGSGTSTSSSEYGSTEYGQGTTKYREPDVVSYDSLSSYSKYNVTKDNLIKEYNAMIESVIKYGGFYVGRYETSIDGNTVASKKSTESKEIKPMTAATDRQMWYGMYDKQKKFAGKNLDGTENSDVMQSSMIWGSQYDAMLNWMLTGSNDAKTRVGSSSYGNHGGSIVGCGAYYKQENESSEKVYDVINNIYDLEGNVYEWILEASGTGSRVCRGGYYNLAFSPSSRSSYGPGSTYVYGGSRLTLYIK